MPPTLSVCGQISRKASGCSGDHNSLQLKSQPWPWEGSIPGDPGPDHLPEFLFTARLVGTLRLAALVT
jgi:hypothetical protein